ncbi:ACT domain-containing protein [Rubrivirga marina]|uniref:Amino acid-binding protein n=1 Tax=Rubrivirga marina TaxID=1196024 RepID=A0A271J1B8_9BACT|nr:ACT domain-containing protein [Rubrivirga marina]PAP76519.1 amino acid-binding protein [Rubrivirga marina]
MTLDVLPGRLAVSRLTPSASVASWMGEGALSSVTRTDAELSVVCDEAAVPAGVTVEGGWRALRVRGPLAFELTGILADLAHTLAEAGVSIFAVSTFDTDVVLVKADRLDDAADALRAAGHEVVSGG